MRLLNSVLLAGLLLAAGAGCAALTKQISKVAPLPDQGTTASDPDKARIYVMRCTSWLACREPATVWDQQMKIGSTGHHGYLCWERDPGDTVVRVFCLHGAPVALPIKCEKGHTYFVSHTLKQRVGLDRLVLTLMPEDEGRQELARHKPPKML